MKLIFRLRFRTAFGESLLITGRHPVFGGGRFERAIPLEYVNQEFWEVALNLPRKELPAGRLCYSYLWRRTDGSLIQDWGENRSVNLPEFTHDEVLIVDSWNAAGAAENAFYTEPFKKILLRGNRTEIKIPPDPLATHTFKIKAPLLAKGQTICILGETPALGGWSTQSPRLLAQKDDGDDFTAQADLGTAVFPLAYKYGVYDVAQKKFVRYEEGENRILHDSVAPQKHTVVDDGFARLPATTWKGAGVAIPIFSLRSEKSFGVGEFTDLKALADWGAGVGLKLIQVLPVNDTTATHTWLDSYPYAAISAFALHPLYLNLSQVVDPENQPLLRDIAAEGKRLNALEAVDYEAVMKAKLGFVRQIFPRQKEQTFKREDYREFFSANRHWLKPYAAFCCLRDRFGSADFNQWPAGMRSYNQEKVEALLSADAGALAEVELNYFIQFHLHVQLQEAAGHVHARGLILKGDIAIGVCRHGADVWEQPELYHTDVQAGAPPDAFAAKGQNWGFPTYNWPRMKQDGFAWWRRRFNQMSVYFDAFRIDHILGFFRIWSSPAHAVEGILGHFVPAIPVGESEFAGCGIPFDRERFVKPFITDPVLAEFFGAEADAVKKEFLTQKNPGRYELKGEFATQRQIENHFAALEPSQRNSRLKTGLFDLVSNVILLEVDGPCGRELHFRIGIADTASFQHLDPQTQARFKGLYVDYFFRRQDAFWMREAMQKLPALKRVTNMLICGEDLGMVPACVPDLMRQLGLLSLEIQRMPKQMGREFSRPQDAPYLSVVTPSTHDMSTIRGWWEEDAAVTQNFFNKELGLTGVAPATCPPELNEMVVAQHLHSPAMWSVFQLQDLLGMDGSLRRADVNAERINVPANPRQYWRYRMHLSLENLPKAEEFGGKLRRLLREAGR